MHFKISSVICFNLDQSKILSSGNELTLFQTSPGFYNVDICKTSLLKILWEKEKLLLTSSIFFSHSVFYLLGELSAIFIKFEIVVCGLFQFGSLKQLCNLEKG